MYKKLSLSSLASFIASMIFPAAMLVGLTVAARLKMTNPENLDITQDLAYLAPTLIAALITMATLTIIVIVLLIITYIQTKSFKRIRLPLLILGANIVLIAGIALMNNHISDVQDQWLIDNGKPTLQQFFDTLEKNK